MKSNNKPIRKKLHRYNIPNHARELTFSCYKRYPFFSDPIACVIFLNKLQETKNAYSFELWAWVVMPNHVHLLLYPGEKGDMIPQVLHRVKGKTGRLYKNHILHYLPEYYDDFCIMKNGIKKFQFWQAGGGYDRNLWNAKAIQSAIAYIEHNPVRAGLASRAEKWPWSSAYARKKIQGLIPDDSSIPMVMQ